MVPEDQCGANQPGFLEEEFSSDEEGSAFDNFMDDRQRRADRLKRRVRRQNTIAKAQAQETPLDQAAHGEVAAPIEQPALSATVDQPAHGEAADDNDVQRLAHGEPYESDSDADDADYLPPEEVSPREAAKREAIAAERRKGRFVNELLVDLEDGETSSDDWPVADIITLATVLRRKL